MRVKLLFVLHLAVALLAPCALRAQDVRVTVSGGEVIVENARMRRVLRVSEGAPGPVVPVSFRLKAEGVELLAAERPEAPWFEVPLSAGAGAGSTVTSAQPVWVLAGHTERPMKHGGVEAEVQLRAAAGPAAGLVARYTVQAYPGATVLRERLELAGDAAARLALRTVQGRPAVVFPRYTFRTDSAAAALREIRLAAWGRPLLAPPADEPSYDDFQNITGWRTGANLSQNYMYHPVRHDTLARPGAPFRVYGPVLLGRAGAAGWMLAFEHGAPDGDPVQQFVELRPEVRPGSTTAGVHAVQGAYFDAEPVSDAQPFATLWAETAAFPARSFDDGEAVLWDFLYRWINDEPASREPALYYNTWGMQRDLQRQGRDVHAVLTEDRVLAEIGYAAELGVQMFVLDDGWQDAFGDWQPHPGRFPNGLAPIRQALDRRGLLFGIWMAPLHTDSTSALVRQHPEWLLRDAAGKPVVGRWNKQVLCLASGYYDQLIAVHRRLIDAGVRHFKWDGVDTNHRCLDPRHHHGTAAQTPAQRADRYAYELPRILTRAIAELKAYRPDVVIEFDATEPDRSIGLSILSEAKYYWMNNGASWYGDRSPFRVKSMRMVPNLYARLIPPVLLNAANYPHDDETYHSQRYAVNTSLLGGLGLWGNLADMKTEERERVRAVLAQARRVLPVVAGIRPEVRGAVGAAPEVYTAVDGAAAAGQVVAFSGTALAVTHRVPGIDPARLLAVVRNAYSLRGDTLLLPFAFPAPDASREAFVLPNGGAGVGVVSSTSWLADARIDSVGTLTFTAGAPGTHVVRWQRPGEPLVQASGPADVRVLPAQGGIRSIEVRTRARDVQVTVRRR